jgi:hypothetical protein
MKLIYIYVGKVKDFKKPIKIVTATMYGEFKGGSKNENL